MDEMRKSGWLKATPTTMVITVSELSSRDDAGSDLDLVVMSGMRG